MGMLLALLFLLSLGVGALVAFGAWVSLRWALQVEAGLVVSIGILGAGALLQRAWRRRWPRGQGWAALSGALAIALVLLSFLLGRGPGRYPPVVDRSIDLAAFLVAGGGIAAALAAMLFGVLAAQSERLWIALSGLLLGAGGVLALQPALADLGQPTVGPLGLAIAIGALLGARLRRPRDRG